MSLRDQAWAVHLSGNLQEAVDILLSSDPNDPDIYYPLHLLLTDGRNIPDLSKTYQYLQKGAQLDCPQCKLMCLKLQLGGTPDIPYHTWTRPQILDMYSEAIDKTDTYSQFFAASFFVIFNQYTASTGTVLPPHAPDDDQSMAILESLIQQNFPLALSAHAQKYFLSPKTSTVCDEKLYSTFQEFVKAAKTGCAESQLMFISYIYTLLSPTVSPTIFSTEFSLLETRLQNLILDNYLPMLQLAAKKNHPKGLAILAQIYMIVFSLRTKQSIPNLPEPNMKLAIQLLTMAASFDYPSAFRSLSIEYELGSDNSLLTSSSSTSTSSTSTSSMVLLDFFSNQELTVPSCISETLASSGETPEDALQTHLDSISMNLLQPNHKLAFAYAEYGSKVHHSVLCAENLSRYYITLGTPADKQKAFEINKDLTARNYPSAFDVLGSFYFNGIGCTPSLANAVDCWQKGAALGNAKCYFELSLCYHIGDFLPKNDEIALEYMKKSAKSHRPALQKLAEWHFNANNVMPSLKPNYTKGIQYLKQAIDRKYIPSLVYLSNLYFSGLYTKKNQIEAINMLQKLKGLKDPSISYPLGYYGLTIFLQNKQKYAKYLDEAVECLTLASSHQHPAALYHLSTCYFHGYGVPQDYATSIQHLQMALAIMGPDSIAYPIEKIYHQLGLHHLNGYATPKSVPEAIKNFKLAIKHPYSSASYLKLYQISLEHPNLIPPDLGIVYLNSAVDTGYQDAINQLSFFPWLYYSAIYAVFDIYTNIRNACSNWWYS